MDFYKIREKSLKKGVIEIYPDFIVGRTNDLMARGKSFYAVWDDAKGMWSTDEYDVARLVDEDLWRYYEKCKERHSDDVYIVKPLTEFSSGSWRSFKQYIQNIADNSKPLDSRVTFANTEVKKKDYVSKRLPYAIKEGPCNAYDEIIGTLYSPEERQKLEWAIGSIIAGDGSSIQKFIVLYGDAGAGKSTILNIIQSLFEGYYTTFDAADLVSNSNAFATASFGGDPLVAIQHDGDLSGIKDNSKLNSIISHEEIIVNEKFKAQYVSRSRSFLFMATNKPVKITDAKSGIIRRLIDVAPSGNKIPPARYNELIDKVNFELGEIAWHCLQVYNSMGKNYYNNYKPMEMMYKTDPFFNFVEFNYDAFERNEGISLKAAYALYKEYCEDNSSSEYKLAMYKFREEFKNYWNEYFEQYRMDDGKHVRSYFLGFKKDKFIKEQEPVVKEKVESWLKFDDIDSWLDSELADCPAQYANEYETPTCKWENVKTKLKDLDTAKLHYTKINTTNHIVVDFDLKDENGNKSFEKNLEAASKWPKTYAELSKSGEGIHLHYIYDGDAEELSRIFDKDIEIKVFTGDSSLRRKLTKCNDIPISHINSGLPLKGEKKMVDMDIFTNEKAIRTMIVKNLNKEYHGATKPSIDYIYDILEKAYASGTQYDVSDLTTAVMKFAMNSSNQSKYCVDKVAQMKFKSEEVRDNTESFEEDKIVFYDVEVFPNLFIVCWKFEGEGRNVVRLINPKPEQIENLLKCKLVGFNCRKYDNHIMYAAMIGYSNMQLYKLSQHIINDKQGFFSEAYNLSYTDIYDFASAGNKKSLKKFEIELGIHHQENAYAWDEPVPEDKWNEIADYCCNDVIATEAVFNHLKGDWVARQILADLTDMTCNDTTNTLSTRMIFGKNKTPQNEFNYRDLSKPVRPNDPIVDNMPDDHIFRIFDDRGYPIFETWERGMSIPDGYSIMPFFPGYKYENGISSYQDVPNIGEGGYVYAEPGMYGKSKTLDVASEHPSSAIEEGLFGPRYTKIFASLKHARLLIKHEEFDELRKMFDGKLSKYVDMIIDGTIKKKDLSNALKTVINSVYGLTAAGFENPFRDKRNVDNIVAKRGSLFMINLRNEVQKRGYTVIHCKTDSIKIENPSEEIEQFCVDYGKEFGYEFEVEHIFDRLCLVNKAVYVAKLAEDDPDEPGKWTATGTQFQVPYVFKTLFSHEEIKFEDMCEVKSVKSAMYLDMNEEMVDGEHNYIFVGRVGNFCPMKDGYGAGVLYRDQNGSYNAVTGTKGFKWMEAEMVKALGKEDGIDRSYYDKLVDAAVDTLKQFGDVERFTADESFEPLPFV